MATIHDITAYRKAALRLLRQLWRPVRHRYPGGWGLHVPPRHDTGPRRVSATDPALVLLGRCDLADAARAADEAAGGLAARICGAETGRH